MAPSKHLQQTYHRGQLRAFLLCSDAGCDLDIVEPKLGACESYHLELLLQPVNESGWPQGSARPLYEADIPMTLDQWSPFSHGRHRLPFRLSEDLLERCHLRLTCRRIPPHP